MDSVFFSMFRTAARERQRAQKQTTEDSMEHVVAIALKQVQCIAKQFSPEQVFEFIVVYENHKGNNKHTVSRG